MTQLSADDLTRMIAQYLASRARCPVEYIARDAIRADVTSALAGEGAARQRLEAVIAAAPAYLLDAYRAAQGERPVTSLEDALRGMETRQAVPRRALHLLLRVIEAQGATDPEMRGTLLLTMPGVEPRRLATLDDLRDELRRPWTNNPRYGCRLAFIPGFGRGLYDVLRQMLGIDEVADEDARP